MTYVQLCSFSNLSVTSSTSQLILLPFRRFIYVTYHSITLSLLHLRSGTSPSLPGETPMLPLLFLLLLQRLSPNSLPRYYKISHSISSMIFPYIIHAFSLCLLPVYVNVFIIFYRTVTVTKLAHDIGLITRDKLARRRRKTAARALAYRWSPHEYYV